MSGTIGKRNTINLEEPPSYRNTRQKTPSRNTQQIPSQNITTRNTQQIPSQKITPPPKPPRPPRNTQQPIPVQQSQKFTQQKQPQEKINCNKLINTKGIETYIYHFDIKNTKNETIKATCWNKVVYVYLSVKQDNALNQFKKLFNKCQPHNILIYITGFKGHPYTEPPEADIKKFIINNTHDFLNVTIINKVKSRDIDDFFNYIKTRENLKK